VKLPIGKNAPVEVSVRVFLFGTGTWMATANVYTLGYLTTVLYAHLVDACADLKVSQTTKIGFGPLADSELLNIPDKSGYWFIGYAMDVQPTAATLYADRLGGGDYVGGTPDPSTGFVSVQNSDGVVFDRCPGDVMKADMLIGNLSYQAPLTLDLFSWRGYSQGMYFRLMPSPISAENLTMTVHPTAAGIATDIWRIVYFYSKKGQAIKAVNAQQVQTTDFGAAGATTAQGSKK